MSGEVPESWSIKPLGEIADLIMGQSPPSSTVVESGNGLPFIQGNAEFGARHPTPRFVALVAPKVVRAGDILISVRAPVGEVNIAEGPLCIGRGICGIRAKGCDPDFLSFAVSGLSKTLARLSQGSTFDAINGKELRSIDILLPPRSEQRRIAEVLRSLDEASLKAQEVSLLEARLGGKLVGQLFAGAGRSRSLSDTPLGLLPSDWLVTTWGTLCSSVGVGIASSATHAYSLEGVPLIRNQNILFGSLDLADLLRVTPEYDQQYASKRLKVGDVVTMRTGYPGRSAVVPRELGGCQTFTTLISRPKQDVVLPSYLCGWINSERGRLEVLRLQAGGAQQNLNAGSLKHLLVPVPPISEQHEIIETVQSFDRNLVLPQSVLDVRGAIICDLLSGRVRVPA